MRRVAYGEALIGFGILFLGLGFLRDSVPDVTSSPNLLQSMALLGGHGFLSLLLFVLIGALLTVLVQSSSAAIAITLTAAFAGWIDYRSAAAIILGENIGTTVTANLAAIGGTLSARRAARAHLLFNLIGVTWMLALFPIALDVVDFILPGSPYSVEPSQSALPAHLAMFHTLFNVVNTTLCIGFIPQLERLVQRIVPGSEEEREPGRYQVPIVGTQIHQSPEFYLVELRSEIAALGTISERMFNRLFDLLESDESATEEITSIMSRDEQLTDEMRDKLTEVLASYAAMETMTERGSADVAAMLRVVDELESIADACYNFSLLAHRRARKKLAPSAEATTELRDYLSLVSQFLSFIREHLRERVTHEEFIAAQELENRVNHGRNALKKASRNRLQNGADVRTELLILDQISQLEHIGDYALNIAQCLAPPAPRSDNGVPASRRKRFGRAERRTSAVHP